MKFDSPFLVYDVADVAFPPQFSENKKMQRIMSGVLNRARLRTRCAEEQRWKCCYCQCEMKPYAGHRRSASLEHFLPVSKGGKDTYENSLAACQRCNNRRGNDDLDENFRIVKIVRPEFSGVAKLHRRALTIIGKGHDFNKWVDSLDLKDTKKSILIKMVNESK